MNRHLLVAILTAAALLPGCGGGSNDEDCTAPGNRGGAPLATRFFAYVAHNIAAPGSVSGFVLNSSTGALTAATGSPFAAAGNPNSITADPLGRSVYVANSTSSSVSAYTVNGTTGGLTPITGSPFTTGLSAPQALAMAPSGAFLFVAHGAPSNSVVAYAVATTGALGGAISTVAAGTNPVAIAVEPGGKYVYAVNAASNSVSEYSIASNGALTSIGTVAAGTSPQAIAIERTGRFAYVANSGTNDISMFSIDPPSGALTSLGTAVTTGGLAPSGIAIDPSGKFFFVSNQNSSTVAVFSIATGGTLTTVGLHVISGANPRGMSIDPSGQFLYVVNTGSASISAYSINSTSGALTNLGTATTTPAANPVAITTLRRF